MSITYWLIMVSVLEKNNAQTCYISIIIKLPRNSPPWATSAEAIPKLNTCPLLKKAFVMFVSVYEPIVLDSA